jgi:hypothetical protein|tara:strand:- start:4057 stop:4296 length:240 start_codon:yes stop_codon:yes gene_type:complete
MNGQTAQYKPMTLGDWMITFLIGCIPIVNFVMLFVWAFGSNTQQSKATWAKAALIWIGIFIVLYFLFFAAIIGSIVGSY